MEIPEPYATQILNWASVSRTINAAIRIVEKASNNWEEDSDTGEEAQHVLSELMSIEPFCNFLHQEARKELLSK